MILERLLSHDLPRSRWLAAALVIIVVGLACAPFLFPGNKALGVAAKVLIFILLVASYDLLLGYTGIVSFAHTMFFGIGAYGIAVASTHLGAGFGAMAAGLGAALAISFALSLLIGLFSLRVKAIFYAMITLAVAAAFQTLASQLPRYSWNREVERGHDVNVVGVLEIKIELVRERDCTIENSYRTFERNI